MTTPATRSLAAVLRGQLAGGDELRMIVGAASATPAADLAHINVVIEGVTLSVPKLKGVTVTAGQPVYVLAGRTAMLAIGTVSMAAD